VAKKGNLKKVIGRIRKSSAAVKKSAKIAPRPHPLGAAADLPKAKLIGKIKTPFNKAELEVFRQMLLDKRRALIGDMNGIEAEALRTNRQEGSGDLSNMPTHPADIGTDNFEQEFTLGLLESERTLLAEINGALERIDNNTYGVCLGTGQPIGAARLKARPWSKYCIEYAKLLEKGLVQPKEEQPSENQDEEAAAPSSDEAPEEEEEFVEEEPEE
jgi:RNA polymerase-binding protein DksA